MSILFGRDHEDQKARIVGVSEQCSLNTLYLLATKYVWTSVCTPWPSRIKVFGDQWVNQWCGVSQGVTKVN